MHNIPSENMETAEFALAADGVQLLQTPTKNTNANESERTPPRSMALKDANTPRRSTRKSTKPIQDYSEIVSAKRITRSRAQAHKEVPSENYTHDAVASEGISPEQPRWTPAKVGRVSHKRSKRNRKNKKKQLELEEQTLESNEKHEEKQKTALHIEKRSKDNAPKDIFADRPDAGLNPTDMELGDDNAVMMNEQTTNKRQNIASFKERTANRTFSLDGTTDRIEASTVVNETTFDASDCVIVSPAGTAISRPQVVASVQPIKDNKTYVLASYVLSDDESASESGSSPAPTTISLITPHLTGKSSFRLPTPYKKRKTAVDEQSNEASETYSPVVQMEQVLTTLPPKEIVRCNIRKRSHSMGIDGCDGEQRQRQLRVNNRVTFFSPANQTADIEELDLLIAKNVKGADRAGLNENEAHHEKSTKMENRKRSISLDDRFRQSNKSPKAVLPKSTPKKSIGTPVKAPTDMRGRTKLPNFAAIHQRNFNKMENLVDHVARKAERAKVLSASATKCATSVTKVPSAVKALAPQAVGSRRIIAAGRLNNNDRPKAVKRIEMPANDIITATAIPSAPPKIGNLPMITIDSLLITKPSKRGAASKIAVVKPISVKSSAGTLSGANQNMSKRRPLNNAAKATAIPMPVQRVPPVAVSSFQFTTLLTSQSALIANTAIKSVKKSGNEKNKTIVFAAADTAKQSTGTNNSTLRGDIVGDRRRKHMEMFKGRDGARTAEKRRNVDQIRGVRSNRRFELQMQHRRNLDSEQ